MEIIELCEDYLVYIEDSTKEKGNRLYLKEKNEIEIENDESDEITIKIPSENGSKSYLVIVRVDDDDHDVFDDDDNYEGFICDCPAFYNEFECKHCAAAAYYLLNNYLPFRAENENSLKLVEEKKMAKVISLPETNPSMVTFKSISSFEVGNIVQNYYSWDYYSVRKCTLLEISGTRHYFSYVENAQNKYLQQVNFHEPDRLELICTCDRKGRGFCKHISAALSILSRKYGDFYFNKFKDFTEEKNSLLASYNLTLDDKESNDFEFGFTYYGELVLISAPSYIVKIDDENALSALFKKLIKPPFLEEKERPSLPAGEFYDYKLGFLFNFTTKQHIHFLLQPLAIRNKNGKDSLSRIQFSKKKDLAYLKELPQKEYHLFEKLIDESILNYLVQMGYRSLSYYSGWQQQMNSDSIETMKEYYHGILKELLPFFLQGKNNYYLPAGKSFGAKNLLPMHFGATFPEVNFKVSQSEKFVNVELFFKVGEELVSLKTQDIGSLFLFHNDKFYLFESYEHIKLLQQFQYGVLKFPASHSFDVMRKLVIPLQSQYAVEVDENLKIETRDAEVSPFVMVSEYQDQYLMLKPQFTYDTHTVEYDEETDISAKDEKCHYLIKRDKAAEKTFFERLRFLHPNFDKQFNNPFYYLPFSEVMKGNWFLKAIRKLQAENITVKGVQNLKKFRYNTAVPKWEMKTGSGIDWFDLEISVSFGEQQVPLRDLQKAIRSGEKVIVLGDGTFGVLPEEWLKQYGMLMKMGEEQDGNLRVNKMHYTVIDELHNLIDEEEILKELEEKKQKLQGIENIKPRPVSKKIKADLRPYQLSGFNWMQVLDELNWGGCLADDMGLGKTLQAICFLQHIKETKGNSTSLVVCPTSLIYNWENELQKFAPGLDYYIYYGNSRNFSDEVFEKYDIILTSYGTMRIDIEELQKHQFEYVILDESQNIKNPEAQVTKAAQILKANNRIVLSGTPVQNNTFDLYAQMHFLNPGFLGNKEFFKSEFATPIDKNGNAEVAAQLRKLIYPFMLRRTKEQVATDLPDKTESILWCEMDKEQRAVYDDYKNYYRHQLINKIEKDGIAKSSIYILEGLMRLRQICDSPIMVKDKEVTTKESVKLEELLREVLENTGEHKILVFSQFTEMLGLIQESFIQNKITHLYLDGSTPAHTRKDLVNQFQTDTKIKAFLISLKAGGIGLNLTAADYVYLVDPWWNPAVEDQAIDRTHRLGQTQKVFAYKMICKDTVEEKILQLQQKKKSLSKELISEEKSFIKKLAKDDVEFLFS